MKKKHIGSSFDEFLEEEEILEECKEEAAKRVLVWQLEQEMKKQNLTKEEVAKRMHTSRAAVNRVLDPRQPSTLRSLTAAARAVGKRLKVSLA
ncbi:MAG: XRE family transcriptional regulator [Parachlamydiaceae bacterium]|nr:XRE family transcriptional regulator [Parachlamydiaceae bacterium]